MHKLTNFFSQFLPRIKPSNIPLIQEHNLYVYASTVIRGSTQLHLTGYVYAIDWRQKRVFAKKAIPVEDEQPFWNSRGGNRGGRGVYVFNGRVYVATAISIMVYDLNLNFIKEIKNEYFAGIHEIFIDDEGIFVTSTLHDLIIKVDFSGNTVFKWWGSKSAFLQEYYKFSARELNISLKFPMNEFESHYNEYVKSEIFHLNAVFKMGGKKMVLANRKKAVIKIDPLPEEIIIEDHNLRSPHNLYISQNGKIYINDTRNQQVKMYDGNTGKRLKTIRTKIFSVPRNSKQFINPGWQRGMCWVRDELFLIGTSPAAIFELDAEQGKIGQILKLENDPAHCIHGLAAYQASSPSA